MIPFGGIPIIISRPRVLGHWALRRGRRRRVRSRRYFIDRVIPSPLEPDQCFIVNSRQTGKCLVMREALAAAIASHVAKTGRGPVVDYGDLPATSTTAGWPERWSLEQLKEMLDEMPKAPSAFDDAYQFRMPEPKWLNAPEPPSRPRPFSPWWAGEMT